MPEIKVTVRDKIATGDGTRIVCGNSDYIVRFDLDAEWEQFITRTMIIVKADRQYQEVVFTGDSVELPVINNCLGINIGLYAGDLHTTTSASFDCVKSARCGLGEHEEPSEDVYNQIVALVESGAVKGEKGDTGEPGPQGEPGSDATVTAENIASALGYTPANSSDIPAVPVQSVNGKTGAVALTAEDVGALPDDTEIPAPYTLPIATADTLGGVKVGEGLQMDGAVLNVKPEGVYELIETITLEEDVVIYAWNKDVAYKKIMIWIECPNIENYATASNKATYIAIGEEFNSNTIVARVGEIPHTTYKTYTSVVMECKNGRLFCNANTSRNNLYNNSIAHVNSYIQNGVYECSEIKAFMIGNLNDTLYTGTKIDIWGVRADA